MNREQLNHGQRIEQFVNEVVQTYIENGGVSVTLNEIADRIELTPYETYRVATAVFRSEGWGRIVPTGNPQIEYQPTPGYLTQAIKDLRDLTWKLASEASTPEGLKKSLDEIFAGLKAHKTLKVDSVC